MFQAFQFINKSDGQIFVRCIALPRVNCCILYPVFAFILACQFASTSVHQTGSNTSMQQVANAKIRRKKIEAGGGDASLVRTGSKHFEAEHDFLLDII